MKPADYILIRNLSFVIYLIHHHMLCYHMFLRSCTYECKLSRLSSNRNTKFEIALLYYYILLKEISHNVSIRMPLWKLQKVKETFFM